MTEQERNILRRPRSYERGQREWTFRGCHQARVIVTPDGYSTWLDASDKVRDLYDDPSELENIPTEPGVWWVRIADHSIGVDYWEGIENGWWGKVEYAYHEEWCLIGEVLDELRNRCKAAEAAAKAEIERRG